MVLQKLHIQDFDMQKCINTSVQDTSESLLYSPWIDLFCYEVHIYDEKKIPSTESSVFFINNPISFIFQLCELN